MTSVLASRYAVVTQAMCETPPSSPTIVGIAVETMVWSRLETSMPASSAEKISLIRRLVSTSGAPLAAAVSRVAVCIEILVYRRASQACDSERAALGLLRGLLRGVGLLGWSGQAGGQPGPGLVHNVGERDGEVAGAPAGQRGAHD